MKRLWTNSFSLFSIAGLICGTAVAVSAQTAVPTPKMTGPIPVAENNFPMLAASRVQEKVDLATIPEVAEVMSSVESKLAGQGRLLVRYSGTEPLLRVMLEGRDQKEITRWANDIASTVKRNLS